VALIPRHRSRFLVPSFSFTHYPTPFQRRAGRISRQRCFRSSSSFSFSRSRLFGSRFTLPSQEEASPPSGTLMLRDCVASFARKRKIANGHLSPATCHLELPGGSVKKALDKCLIVAYLFR
jgi:hypothetical protein